MLCLPVLVEWPYVLWGLIVQSSWSPEPGASGVSLPLVVCVSSCYSEPLLLFGEIDPETDWL